MVVSNFTPSEASHVIINLIDEKINFHKIQRLQIWEGNHQCVTDNLDGRIKQLELEKSIAKEFINNAKSLGKDLKINGLIEMTIID